MPKSSRAEPDVSFVIPAWNEEAYIEAALQSVAAQTHAAARLEAVVADNGSSDQTSNRVRSFAASKPGPSVMLVRLEDRARSRAKNRGAQAASGRLLVFIDADSRAAPNLAQEVIRRSAAGFAAGSVRVVADSMDPLDRGFFGFIEWGKSLFGIKAQMFFCQRSIFLAMGGFDEELDLAEDVEFLSRLQRAGHRACHITNSWIWTSPRRLRTLPLRLGMAAMFGRWALAHAGIGRRWRY